MAVLVLELVLIIFLMVIILVALKQSDTKELKIDVERPWKFSIEIKRDKHVKKIHKKEL